MDIADQTNITVLSPPSAVVMHLGDQPHLSTTSFQGVVESDKVSPEPPLLQTKQAQFPQLLLIRLVLHIHHHLR